VALLVAKVEKTAQESALASAALNSSPSVQALATLVNTSGAASGNTARTGGGSGSEGGGSLHPLNMGSGSNDGVSLEGQGQVSAEQPGGGGGGGGASCPTGADGRSGSGEGDGRVSGRGGCGYDGFLLGHGAVDSFPLDGGRQLSAALPAGDGDGAFAGPRFFDVSTGDAQPGTGAGVAGAASGNVQKVVSAPPWGAHYTQVQYEQSFGDPFLGRGVGPGASAGGVQNVGNSGPSTSGEGPYHMQGSGDTGGDMGGAVAGSNDEGGRGGGGGGVIEAGERAASFRVSEPFPAMLEQLMHVRRGGRSEDVGSGSFDGLPLDGGRQLSLSQPIDGTGGGGGNSRQGFFDRAAHSLSMLRQSKNSTTGEIADRGAGGGVEGNGGYGGVGGVRDRKGFPYGQPTIGGAGAGALGQHASSTRSQV